MLAQELESMLEERADADGELAELREAVSQLRRRLQKVRPDLFRPTDGEEGGTDAGKQVASTP